MGGCGVSEPVMVDSGVTVGQNSKIGPYAIVGRNTFLGKNIRLENSVVFPEATVSDNAVVTIDGSDFAVDGTDVGYIELTSVLGLGWSNEPHRRLTGTLLSGEPLDNDFRIGENARIVLVPEPGTALMIGVGGFALLRRRRQT